jgi:hypothetical protein
MNHMSALKLVLFLLLLGMSHVAQSQQKEANIWYFGTKAGISFRTSPPTALTNGQMTTTEGCATISTFAGRVLFYTDGINVWDSTHSIMPNGSGLKGHSSSTQSAIIVPRQTAARNFIFSQWMPQPEIMEPIIRRST